MAFSIRINKDSEEQFLKVMALYPQYMWVNAAPEEDKYNIMFLGEDLDADSRLQEALIEHIDEIEIEENLNEGP